jgi:uncharacterized protein involved in exopolysaccharide biosynthesis/Mrp family chromosome partitioning ATPase
LLLVCGIAFATVLLRQPHYEAAARVQVVMDSPQLAGINGGTPVDRDYFTTQVKLLESRRVLHRAVENLIADNQWAFDRISPVDTLRKRIQVRPVGGSRLIDIVASSPTADSAAALANQVAAAFTEVSADARRAANERLVDRVRQEIARYDEEIKTRQQALEQFRQEHLTTGPEDRLAAIRHRISNLEEQQTQASVRCVELASICLRLEDYLAGSADFSAESITEVAGDVALAEYKGRFRALVQEEDRLAQMYLPGYPGLRSVRQQIADLQERVAGREHELVTVLLAQFRQERRALDGQQEEIARLLTEQRQSAIELASLDSRYQSMLSEIKRAEAFRAECMSTVREFALREGVSESPVMVVDAAQIPAEPAGLKKSHQAASILLLGLLFSTGFVFAWERFVQDRSGEEVGVWPTPGAVSYWPGASVWTPPVPQPATASASGRCASTGSFGAVAEDVPEAREFTPNLLGVLGSIELGGRSQADAAFASRCRIVMSDPSSTEAATFRDLAASLTRRFGGTRQSLVITNILPYSGKTTVACNLAILLAQAGRKVLLVDANSMRPALHRVYPVPGGQPGLDQVLQDPGLLDQALCRTSEVNLTLLANPEQESGAGEVNESVLRVLADTLAQNFDWVIYDAGAVQQDLVKKLLMVIGKAICVAGTQETHELNAALEQVELCGAVAVGLVQNLHMAEQPVGTSS